MSATPLLLTQRESFIELDARARAYALLDAGSARELIDPFERIKSPWLPKQGIVAQADDGVVVLKGTLDGTAAVVAAIDGAYQGGSMGEVGGAKIAAALELAAQDNRQGVPTCAVLLLETGGVRLQEANLGLAAIADIHAAIADLRRYQPVVGMIAGPVGCYGGMGIAAGLCSYLIVTREARLGLNGPAVIEQEAGVDEFDSHDRPFIWGLTGGEQRHASGLADEFVADDLLQIRAQLSAYLRRGVPELHRSQNCDGFVQMLDSIDPETDLSPTAMRALLNQASMQSASAALAAAPNVDENELSRGAAWLSALTHNAPVHDGFPSTVRVVDAPLGNETARFIAVVPDASNRFARVRNGEVGLAEGWHLARAIRQWIVPTPGAANAAHEPAVGSHDGVLSPPARPRPIIAVIDVPSQAYGRLEEGMGIHQALAAAIDAGAEARLAGHPFVGLIVGQAISGAFLALGCQANRLIALRDAGVQVHAMGKASAARITQRTVEQLEALSATVPPMAYDIDSYATLGMLWRTMQAQDADQPTDQDLAQAQALLCEAVADIRGASRPDLSGRLGAPNRSASLKVRARMRELWAQQ